MPEGDITIYNQFKEQVLLGVHNLANGGDTIQITLHTSYTPDIDTDDVWATISGTEYGTGSGYTAGGQTLANQAVSQDNTNDWGKFDADDVTWSSLGPLSPATPDYAVIWDDTHASDSLICYILLGTTATNGGNYTISFHTNGILVLN